MAGSERHWQKVEGLFRQWAADLDKGTSAHRVLAYQWLLGQPLVLGVLHDALGPLLVVHPPRAQREPREPLPGRAPRAREAGPPWVLLSTVRMAYGPEFQEIAHCGGKVIVTVSTDANGQRGMSLGMRGSMSHPAAWVGVYALPQGIPVAM